MLIEGLQRLINQVLSLDEKNIAALGELTGRSILFQLSNPSLQFYLLASQEGIRLMTQLEQAADVRVKISMTGFILMLFSRSDAYRPTQDMEIAGDVHLLQTFQGIMFSFDPDWEGRLEGLIGAYMTHRLGRFLGDCRRYMHGSLHHCMSDISDYLRFEQALVPNEWELEDFYQGASEMRSAADRLELRITRLEQTLGRVTGR